MRLSIAERAALVGPFDYTVLKIIYSLKDENEFIPYSKLQSMLGKKSENELRLTLTKLLDLKLIHKNNAKYEFKLTYSGLDILAVKILYINKILNKLGTVIGEGKESIVYRGYDFNNDLIAIKFHRIGKNSYKKIRRRKEAREKSWLSLTVENAKREYIALRCVSDNGGYVPKPLGLAYNAVAMEFINGVELREVNNLDENIAKEIYDKILDTMRIAFSECKVIHGDLSPYNIMINDQNEIRIIDWPQAINSDSEDSLRYDIYNIISFFRKFGINDSIESVMKYVRGIT